MKNQASDLKVWLKFIPHTLVMLALLLLILPSVSGTQSAPESREIISSQELLEGASVNGEARYVFGDLRAQEASADGELVYQETFRIDAGTADSIAPASELEGIGVERAGQTSCTLADGTIGECSFGNARIEFMGEMREGRVIFGPEDVQPTLGLSALQAIGFTVDPETQTLKRASATGASQ